MQQTTSQPQRKSLRSALPVVLLAVLVGAVAWNLRAAYRHDVRPAVRKSTDFWATWRCLACGHTVEASAGAGPRECPSCGQAELYTSIQHSCAQHGVFSVAFNYDERGRPSQVKVADGPWAPYVDKQTMSSGLVCPVCGRVLLMAERPRLPDEPPSLPAASPRP